MILYLLFSMSLTGLFGPGKIPSSANVRSCKIILVLIVFYGAISIAIPYLENTRKFNYPEAIISIKNILLDSLACYIVFYYFYFYKNGGRPLIFIMVIVIGIAGSLTVLDGISNSISLFGFDEQEKNRPRGAFGEPNQTALIFALYTPLITSFLISKTKYKLIYLCCAFAAILAIIITSSRGGVLALAIGLLTFLFLIRKHTGTGYKILLSISIPLCGIIFWNVLPDNYTELIVQRFSFLGEKKINVTQASAGRTYLWTLGYEMWLKAPIFGAGWTAFKSATGLAAHNTFLQYLIELGVIGAFLFILFWYKSFKFLLEARKFCHTNTDAIILCGFASGLVALMVGLFFVNLYKPWFFAWSYIAVGHAFAHELSIKTTSSKRANENRIYRLSNT
ncbi:O-antigen ligase family protein [Methylomonas sp. MgM2]